MSNGFMIFLNVWGLIVFFSIYIRIFTNMCTCKIDEWEGITGTTVFSALNAFCIFNLIELIG